jgi:flagellar biosynthesis/type III secretory pathway M-ring protein FliF/YscJ
MDAWVWIVIAAVVVAVIAIVAIVVMQQRRRAELRESFGPEYDRAVAREGDVRRGESDLKARRERRAELDIRPLSPASRTAYAQSCDQTHAGLVDTPSGSL